MKKSVLVLIAIVFVTGAFAQTTRTFRDSRDGKKYKTVKIGNQVWMAENLTYKPSNGSYWAYNNNKSNVAKYGYLYDWETAKESCPNGWRLPTQYDWLILLTKYGGDQSKDAYNALIKNGNSNFNTILSGLRTNHAQYRGMPENKFAGFWSISTGEITGAWSLIFSKDNNAVIMHGANGNKSNGLSIRCIKGEPIKGDNDIIDYKTFKDSYENEQIKELGILANGVKIGEWKSYYENGQLEEKSNYLDGKLSGEWKVYTGNGDLSEKGYYLESKKTGTWKHYYDGKLSSIGNNLDDKKTGEWKSYQLNGKLSSVGNYLDNKATGEWKMYHENGKLKGIGGLLNNEYINTWKMYHDNGNIQVIYNFSEGKVNGKVESFYKNGKLESSGSYSLGILVGEWKNYYETGKLKSIGEYSSNGQKEGKWKTYHENGKLSTEGKYFGGVPEGKWIHYSKDGILIDAPDTGSFTDSRDGKTYKTVKVGNQVWMAENFAYKPNNGNYLAYDNIAKYGYFYDWETAKNIAPKGWHLPSEEEYLTLLNYYDKDYHAFIAGGESYFNAILLGIGYENGSFDFKGDFVGFWAESNTTYHFVPHFKIHAQFESAEMTTGHKNWRLNVRLIKD